MLEIPFTSSLSFHVRSSEINLDGNLRQTVYISWMDEARLNHLALRGIDVLGEFSIRMSSLNVKYFSPIQAGDIARVRCWIVNVKSRAINFQYEILHDQKLAMIGQTEHICCDQEGKVRTIPAQWRSRLFISQISIS